NTNEDSHSHRRQSRKRRREPVAVNEQRPLLEMMNEATSQERNRGIAGGDVAREFRFGDGEDSDPDADPASGEEIASGVLVAKPQAVEGLQDERQCEDGPWEKTDQHGKRIIPRCAAM